MSYNQAKGTKAETAVESYLATYGWASRQPKRGAKDEGDVLFVPGPRVPVAPAYVLEVKAAKDYKLAQWMREAAVEAQHYNDARGRVGYPTVVMKPRGVGYTDLGKWWVLMTLEQFRDIS